MFILKTRAYGRQLCNIGHASRMMGFSRDNLYP